jgi:hypothetical protein
MRAIAITLRRQFTWDNPATFLFIGGMTLLIGTFCMYAYAGMH